MNIMERLKAAIHETHQNIELLPFTQRLMQGTLSRNEYVALLVQLEPLHREFEAELASRAEVRPVYHEGMDRLPQVQQDLVALGVTEQAATVAATEELLERIAAWGREKPHALLGALYVFEGSRMGSMVLVKPLARCLGVALQPGTGLDYHLHGQAERFGDWQRFKGAMLSLTLSEAEAEAVLEGAMQAMDGMYAIYAALPLAAGHKPTTPAEAAVTGRRS